MTSPARPLTPQLTALAAVTLLGLAAVGSAAPARAASTEDGPAASVSAGGITLKSASVALPGSDRMYPDGPHVAVMNNNCLTCHSAGMVLTQPHLTPVEWQGEVTKMVKVYKAPVAPEDAALIVEYLAQLKPPR